MYDINKTNPLPDLKVGLAIILCSMWVHLIMAATENQLLGIIPFVMGAFPTRFPSTF